MHITEIQLRKKIRAILNELLTRRKGKESWVQHALDTDGGAYSGGGGGTDYGGDYDYDDYGDGDYGDMGESDEAEPDED